MTMTVMQKAQLERPASDILDAAVHIRPQMLQLFNEYHRDPALDEWRRSAADGPKELRFLFDYPEAGWSDMHVLIDGQLCFTPDPDGGEYGRLRRPGAA